MGASYAVPCSGPQLSYTEHVVNYATDAMNTVDKNRNTWLHVACENGNDSMLLRFIQQCPYINLEVTNTNGETPLSLAIRQGKQRIVEILLEAGVKVNQQTGTTPLHEAARAGHRIFIELLIKRGAQIEATNKSRYTPLHTAAQYQQGEAVNALVRAGANINAISLDGKPIHVAVANASFLNQGPDSLNTLVDAGANLDEFNGNNPPPLVRFLNSVNYLSILEQPIDEFRVIEVLTGLLDRRANVNITDKDKETPLHVACKIRKIGIIQLLLDRGAAPNVCDKKGETPFYKFSLCANDKISLSDIIAITRALREAGAEIDRKTSSNYQTIIRDEEEDDKHNPEIKELKQLLSKRYQRTSSHSQTNTSNERLEDQLDLNFKDSKNPRCIIA